MRTRNMYTHNSRMKDVVSDNPHLLPVLSRFGIPLGFGDAYVSDVCRERGVDTPTFLAVTNLISGYQYSHPEVELITLIRYLRNAHDYFMGYALPYIRTRFTDTMSSITGQAEFAVMFIDVFDNYVSEMRESILHENDKILSRSEGYNDPDFRDELEKFQQNHHNISLGLQELKELLIGHFSAEEAQADRLNSLLFDLIALEKDLLAHTQVEDLLFVPALLGLNSRKASEEDVFEDETKENLDSKGDIALTPREKDIVRAIANGLSNKEIAEKLFLSVHTVTTHRRNISSKLGIHSAAGMTLYAVLHGLLTLEEGKKLLK